jgi:hypothetical protein
MSTRTLKKLALLLTFWVALHMQRARATDATYGNLTVTGTTTLEGTVDVQGNTVTEGTRTDNSQPGWGTIYTDGTTSILEFDASRSANIWKWQQNAGATLQLQMTLDNNNALKLYNSSGTTEITLSPTGTSSFANSLTVNGTDSEMPNQTLVNGSSILTEGLADGRYLSSSAATVGLMGGSASGVSSVAWGAGTTASGNYAFAGGNNSVASATGAIALGSSNTASGSYSFAAGNGAIASGFGAVAMGYNANGDYGDAPVNGVTASGQYSAAFGLGHAAGDWSFATSFATACGFGSMAGGGGTSDGDCSIAVGRGTVAIGESATAFGYFSNTTADFATALGQGTANGNSSTAVGASTASGNYSTAMGQSIANGDYSTASGSSTTASAYDSFVIGTYNLGLSSTGAAASATTWVPTDPLFEVGNGNGGTPSDALVVYKNGNVTAQGVISSAAGGDIPMYQGN